MAMTTAEPAARAVSDPARPGAGGSCFLTVHGTVLCFEPGAAGFMHAPLTALPPSIDLVVAEADVEALRDPDAGERAIHLRVRGPSTRGRPRALGMKPSGRTGSVNLIAGESFLSAGRTGGAVVASGEAHAWEEFLPVDHADVSVLRDLATETWISLRDARVLPPCGDALLQDFEITLGDRRASLRDNPLLADPRCPGEIALLVTDARWIDRLRRFAPRLLWRNDGHPDAEEEIELGLGSLVAFGGYDGPIIVQTSRSAEALAEAVPGLDAGRLAIVAPGAGTDDGLLRFGASLGGGPEEAGPVLCLSNGILCDAPIGAMFRSVAALETVLAAPWTRAGTAVRTPGDAGLAEGEAVDAAVLALPSPDAWAIVEQRVAALRRRAPDTADRDDATASALLREALTAGARPASDLFRGFVRSADAGEAMEPGARRGLLNLREVPPPVRVEVMRQCAGRRS